MALGHESVAACQAAVSSREFSEWVAFDGFEPIGSRTTPELLALLVSVIANQWKSKSDRLVLPQDILHDPLAPVRLDPAQEGARVRTIASDYRRLRAERLAKMAESSEEQVH